MASNLSLGSPRGKPWRFTGTAMRPNTLLLCKLLFLLVAIHGIHDKFRDPYLPFLPALDLLREIPGLLPGVLTAVFWVGGAALLLNWRVRTAAVLLGITVILAILASKPVFQNHAFIVGCIFLLCGLQRPGEAPWLIRWQFVVLYFGSLLSKVIRPDWWSGAFMHTWMHDDLGNQLYEFGSAMFPVPWFAAGASWLVMLAEFVLLVLFLVRRWNPWAVWGVVIVHSGFLAVVGPGPFGYFTEVLLIALLAFLTLPCEAQQIHLHDRISRWAGPVFFLIDWDGRFRLGEPPQRRGDWLELRDGEDRAVNLAGLIRFLAYNPAFYVGLFVAYAAALRIL
jgi:hypothetical protein